MRITTKLLLMPVLLAVACVMAGVYGMGHDQLSYAVSPEYFHHLKFDQFRIDPARHNRIGAAMVGWSATWWMGLLVGPPLILIGLLIPDPWAYAVATAKSFLVAIITAAAVGLFGLALAIPISVRDRLPHFDFPNGVEHPEAFLEVGVLHTASYLGGLIGLFAALIYLIHQCVQARRKPPGELAATPSPAMTNR
ncbi:hypothetical protein OT109_05205 [Phycisphaeraceae bacterium D3-23]